VRSRLCTPFSTEAVNIVREIATQPVYGSSGTTRSNASCNFAGTIENDTTYRNMVEKGDIYDGGLTAAAGLILEGNNAYSAIFNLQAETANRVSTLVAQQMQKLDYGDGYFSIDCEGEDGSVGTCTPGELVSRQVDDWLGGALSELEVADEAGEILNQLISGMVQAIFSNVSRVGGLLAGALDYDDNPYADGSAYNDSSPTVGTGTGYDPSTGGSGTVPITSACHYTGDLFVDFQCVTNYIPTTTNTASMLYALVHDLNNMGDYSACLVAGENDRIQIGNTIYDVIDIDTFTHNRWNIPPEPVELFVPSCYISYTGL